MRPIEFRAWSLFYKEMHYFPLDEMEFYYKPEVFELMQFTGLHDKNEKKAFHQDIAMDNVGNPPFVIEWDYLLLARLQEIEFEVIGNIYENPELIEDNANPCKNNSNSASVGK
jgi:hypothetical protein